MNIDLGLIDKTDDLKVRRGLDVLNSSQSTSGDKTSATTWLSAPGDFLTLSIGDGGVGFRRCPKTEIWIKLRQHLQKYLDDGDINTIEVV